MIDGGFTFLKIRFAVSWVKTAMSSQTTTDRTLSIIAACFAIDGVSASTLEPLDRQQWESL